MIRVGASRQLLLGVGLLTVIVNAPLAIDSIPETSGFSGYILVAPGVFEISSNLIYSGAPLVDDVANTRIDSILDAPSSQTAPALGVTGEVNYTFSGARTQLFFGNRLEDMLRLDVAFSAGVRQELPDKSILALSAVGTPVELKVWSDPYVENQDRVKTELNQPGARLRWGRILGTGLELTFDYRRYEHDDERSGEWLVGQGRLGAGELPLLNRDGNIWKAQALYRIRVGEPGRLHVFEPSIRYTDWDLDGDAMAHSGPAVKLSYLYIRPKLVLDVILLAQTYDSDAVHPAYGRAIEADRFAVGLVAFYDLFGHERWRAFASLDFLRENANIDFFDSEANALLVGAIWRHRRK